MELEQLARNLGDALLNSAEYKRYMSAKEKLFEDKNLLARVNEYRKRNFYIQNSIDHNKIDQLNSLMGENYELLSNRYVKEYFDAELILCRAIQNINNIIIDGIDLDLEFLD